jgi:uncharacterized protein YcbK (DUF882 family)
MAAKNIKLSKNFTYDEMIHSATAKRLNIDNTPNARELENLKVLCQTVLQPIRDKRGSAITVTSGYRCPKLNALVGGSKTSQHAVGQAADITLGNPTLNKKLFNMIVDMINKKEIRVGQLIDEYNYRWLHISTPYSKVNNIIHIK